MSRGRTTTDRRTGPADRRTERRARRDDRSGVGRSVAERALRQIRLVAVALVLLGAAGYRPDGASASCSPARSPTPSSCSG